jgi:hypothetical protein
MHDRDGEIGTPVPNGSTSIQFGICGRTLQCARNGARGETGWKSRPGGTSFGLLEASIMLVRNEL